MNHDLKTLRPRLGLFGLTLSASVLTACGDPCLDDGLGKPGAVCAQSTAANESSTGTTAETGTDTADSNEGNTADAGSETATETGTETGTETAGADEFWCVDEDGDGFGDADNCVPVPPGQEPPAGSVPMNQATDCDDGDPNTFPGAAELDNPPDACMTDADDDGYGDDMPSNPNAVPGSDCNDANVNTFPGAAELDDPDACMEDDDDDGFGDLMPVGGNTVPGSDCDDADMLILACEIWCLDVDMDGFGDGSMCVPVIPGQMPPPGHVMDNTDCVDSDPNTFPGAAELDDPNACMTDADMDGWGEGMPAPGVVSGRDCDDTDMTRVVCVEATPGCADSNLGMGTQLDAIATGGDGNYTWLWDNAMTLTDPMISNPIAMPTEITTYTATATDSSGNVGTDSVTVHLLNAPWVLGGVNAQCMAYGFVGNPPVPAPHSFANMDTTTCTTGNSDPTAYVCPTVHENARITGTMIVNPPADDDDFIGFVWGWQNPDQFYMLHWKQGAQNIGGCNSAAGITVKLFDRTQPYAFPDFSCNTSTVNQTVLLTPAQTTTAGWVHGVTYGVELLYATDQTEITITDTTNNQVVANFIVMDSTYPSGQFGTYDYSQIRACNGPWNSSCL